MTIWCHFTLWLPEPNPENPSVLCPSAFVFVGYVHKAPSPRVQLSSWRQLPIFFRIQTRPHTTGFDAGIFNKNPGFPSIILLQDFSMTAPSPTSWKDPASTKSVTLHSLSPRINAKHIWAEEETLFSVMFELFMGNAAAWVVCGLSRCPQGIFFS